MNKFCFSLLLLTGLIACQNNPTDADSVENAVTEQDTTVNHYGEHITVDGAISYDEMLSRMEGVDSMEVKVSGVVDAVCQAKGCWMNIASSEAGRDPLFVKFKDYGFFVPKDIAGRTVIMEGKVYRELTPVDELRHYAEDEGKSEEYIASINEPKEELKFMASGVILLD